MIEDTNTDTQVETATEVQTEPQAESQEAVPTQEAEPQASPQAEVIEAEAETTEPVELDDPTSDISSYSEEDDYEEEDVIDYGKITDSFKTALNETKEKPKEDSDKKWLTEEDLAGRDKAIEERIVAKFQEEQRRVAQVRNQAKRDQGQTLEAYDSYSKKLDGSLKKAGIELKETPLLNELVNEKMEHLITRKQQELGRTTLKPHEFNQVAKSHWKSIQPFLPKVASKAVATQGQSLSPAASGTSPQATKPLPVDQKAIQDYKARSEAGNVSSVDALKMLESLNF